MALWDGTRWVPDVAPAPTPPRFHRIIGASAEALLIVILTFGLVAGATLAARGNGKGGGRISGTIALVLLDGGDQLANYGERAAFEVATDKTDRPFVGVRCYQGGTWVYDAYTGYFADYRSDPWVTLASPYWDTANGADCVARLFHYDKRGRQQVLATTEFVVAP